jgi:hypothetical protein
MCIASVNWGASQSTVAALNSLPLHRRLNKSPHSTVPDTLHNLPKMNGHNKKLEDVTIFWDFG